MLRYGGKLPYPATSRMSPVYGFIALAGGNPDGSLGAKNSMFRGQIGPLLVFASAMTNKEVAGIRTMEEFDRRASAWDQDEDMTIFSSSGSYPLLLAYNPRNFDTHTGAVYDSGPCNIHGRVYGAGTRYCSAQHIKDCAWHLGGPGILIPLLLVHGREDFSPISSQPMSAALTSFEVGPKAFAQTVSLIAELLRGSSVNQVSDFMSRRPTNCPGVTRSFP